MTELDALRDRNQRRTEIIMALGLFDLTEQDRQLIDLLAKSQETADAAVDLFTRLTRPRNG